MTREAIPLNTSLYTQRKLRGWSQAKLAELIGASEEMISKWERGKKRTSPFYQEKLCELFGMNAQELGFLVPASDNTSYEVPATQKMGERETMSPTLFPQYDGTLQAADFPLSQPIGERVSGLEGDIMDKLRRQILEHVVKGTGIAILNNHPSSSLNRANMHEISLPYFEELIKECWSLLRVDGLVAAEQLLLSYLPNLEIAAQQRSHQQKTFAGLASQGYILAGLVTVLQTNLVLAESYCKLAVHYSRLSGDRNLEIAALKHLATKFFDAQYPMKALNTYQEALPMVDDVSPLLRSRTYLGLALAHARCQHKQEALRYLGLAQATFPQYPEDDPGFSFADCGRSSINHYAGLICLEFDQPREAWNSFAEVEMLKSKTVIPERTLIEIVNCQAEAAIAQGEMELACTHIRAGIAGAIKLGSEKRFHEAFSAYKQMHCLWPGEQQVKEVAELFHR